MLYCAETGFCCMGSEKDDGYPVQRVLVKQQLPFQHGAAGSEHVSAPNPLVGDTFPEGPAICRSLAVTLSSADPSFGRNTHSSTSSFNMLALRHRRNRDDVDWFDRAVDEHKDRLYTFARYYLRDEHDAADVTQDVLIRLWTNRHNVDRDRAGAWLNRVCRNACVDRLRHRTTRRHVEVDDETVAVEIAAEEALPDASAHNGQLQKIVLDRIDEMGEPFRTLIIMREIQDMPYADIAAALDLPLNTVKVYLHRARHRLREALPAEIRNEVV